MPDFGSLLKNPSGTAKKPENVPADDYPAIIKSFEFGDANKNKTPYLRVQFGFTGPGAGDGNAEALAALGIDVTKRQMRRDFYLRGKDANDAEATNACMYRLDEFLRTAGVEPNGTAYEELIPQIVGAQVLVSVQHRLNENSPTGEFFTEINKVAKLS